METARQARVTACARYKEFWQAQIAPRIQSEAKEGRFHLRLPATELDKLGMPMREFQSGFEHCMANGSGYTIQETHTYGSYKGYNAWGDKTLMPVKAVDGVQLSW